MKKKVQQSGEKATPQSCDYLVGQVSGSLFPEKSGQLSSLFTTVAPAAPLRFQAAITPVSAPPAGEQRQELAATVPGSVRQKRPRAKSAAEQSLERKEVGLATADEDERAAEVPVKKKKKKKEEKEPQEEAGQARTVEQWVQQRHQLRERRREEALKSRRTVFVGNLPLSCTKKTLRSLFRASGAVESVRFRSVVREDPTMSLKLATIKRRTHPKKRSLNAYVVFKEETSVAMAILRNGTELEKDFHIRVDRVTDESKQHDHRRSVFVGNLSFEINECEFRRHFIKCGAIQAVRLVRDHDTGLGKGFGYVLFQDTDSVQLALKLDGSQLDGRAIRVKRSMKKDKTKVEDKRRTSKGPGTGHTNAPQQGALSSFKGEMAKPGRKAKKISVKKRKSKKMIHI